MVQVIGWKFVRRIGKSLMHRCDLVRLVGNVVEFVGTFCNGVLTLPEVVTPDVNLYKRRLSVGISVIHDGALEPVRRRVLEKSGAVERLRCSSWRFLHARAQFNSEARPFSLLNKLSDLVWCHRFCDSRIGLAPGKGALGRELFQG